MDETLFPDGSHHFYDILVDGRHIIPDVAEGQSGLAMKGCLTYSSMGLTHHTRYCYSLVRGGKNDTLVASPQCGGGEPAD